MNQQWNFGVRAYRNLCTLGVDFLFFRQFGDRREIMLPVEGVIESNSAMTVAAEPSVSMGEPMAQQMIQALWDAGFRPANGAGSGAEAEALRSHIEFAEAVAGKLLAKVAR